jgi:FixJ family two-component response regulator
MRACGGRMAAEAAPPIVFVSAPRPHGEAAAMCNGAVAFLHKPFTAEELLGAVSRALR